MAAGFQRTGDLRKSRGEGPMVLWCHKLTHLLHYLCYTSQHHRYGTKLHKNMNSRHQSLWSQFGGWLSQFCKPDYWTYPQSFWVAGDCENLHFEQVPKWYWHCWFRDHALRTILLALWNLKNFRNRVHRLCTDGCTSNVICIWLSRRTQESWITTNHVLTAILNPKWDN